jgi:tetratricopeptide (TPR) repeat protein
MYVHFPVKALQAMMTSFPMLAAALIIVFGTYTAAQATPAAMPPPLKPVATGHKPSLAQGYNYYAGHRYDEASRFFWQAIQKEDAGANGYIYMAICQYALGHVKHAIQLFRYVRDTYKGTTESAAADKYLEQIAPEQSSHGAKSGSLSSASNQTPLAMFLNHIEIVRPIIGHPEVSTSTIATFKGALNRLPLPVQNILAGMAIKISITPTLADKFPALAFQEGRGYEGQTYKRCPGMYKHDTIILCERLIDEGSNEVEAPMTSAHMTETFNHEIGHALDACLGQYSMKDDYRHAYYLDLAGIPADAAARLAYYMQKSEAGQQESCAEITAVCLNLAVPDAEDIKTYFPLTMAFIKKTINADQLIKR